MLPNIRKMMKESIWGKPESTLPPVTGRAWLSLATVKNSGKHGCYDCVLPKASLAEFEPITTNHVKSTTLYEILNRTGGKCKRQASWGKKGGNG